MYTITYNLLSLIIVSFLLMIILVNPSEPISLLHYCFKLCKIQFGNGWIDPDWDGYKICIDSCYEKYDSL